MQLQRASVCQGRARRQLAKPNTARVFAGWKAQTVGVRLHRMCGTKCETTSITI
jgi:hypothetical protein